jgi:hypothetical protein
VKEIFLSIIFSWILNPNFAQPIPFDSLYLGQIPPDNIPKKFNLSASPGFATIERIAICKDGKSIFYHENNGYDTSSIGRIKYYRYDFNKWIGPFVLFEGATSPALSVTCDTIYFGKNGFAWYSVKKNAGWTLPIMFSLRVPNWHYLQVTNSGTFYVAIDNAQGNTGGKDWSKIIINQNDTIITSLGTPINSTKDDLDFYISGDESYIIFASDHEGTIKYGYSDLYISYRTNNNTWTTPINLGNVINDPAEARWGPYVSPDKKYLFYSHGSKPDYSDANTNWVRIDNLVDSLKKTNYQICY